MSSGTTDNERNEKIFMMRLRGRTLAMIGFEFGISKERVRSIIDTMIRKFFRANRAWANAENRLREANKEIYRLRNQTQENPAVSAGALDTDIDDIGLSVRAYNGLKNARINTVGDIVKLSRKELLAVRYLGKRSADEIAGVLDLMGVEHRIGRAEEGIETAGSKIRGDRIGN